MGLVEAIIIVCILIFLLHKYGTRKFDFWKKKSVKEMNPYPFIGDNRMLIDLSDPLTGITKIYNYFKGERFGGVYIFQEPYLIIKDPELLKQVLIKDAEYFLNRYNWMEYSDPLLSRSLFLLKDEKWKAVRSMVTTVFTSSKMKDMFVFMQKCAEQATEYVESIISKQTKSKNPDGDVLTMELKDFFARYGTDVIATTAFGIEVDSFRNPSNEFFAAGDAVRNFGRGFNFIKIIIMMVFPKISKALKLTFFGEKLNDFFISVVSEAIKNREKYNIVRKDIIHVLMEARKQGEDSGNGDITKGKLLGFTDIDITAQAVLFFFGGFDAIASLLAFTCYELAVNPEVQEKLYQELNEVIRKENGITYDGVMFQAQYMDMVINETLRKWPPTTASDREVSKTYIIPKTETSPELVLNKGDKLLIPIVGYHYDSEHFPNPEKFDPERFKDEKSTIKPLTFLPFGAGMRHCVGMRFALLEVKTCLFHLLRKFEVVTIKKTPIPLKLERNGALILKPKGGFWLGLKLRS